MAEADIVEALAECLEAQRRGEAAVQACLARYPLFRTELEALLEVAALIPRLDDEPGPSAAFRERARRLILEQPGRPSDPLGWQRC